MPGGILKHITARRKTIPNTDLPGRIGAKKEYRGFVLYAAPISEGGLWRVAGRISRPNSDQEKAEYFQRVDTYADYAEAVNISLQKACRIVDEQGRALFSNNPEKPGR